MKPGTCTINNPNDNKGSLEVEAISNNSKEPKERKRGKERGM